MEYRESRWLHDDDFEKDMDEVSDFKSPSLSPINRRAKPNLHVQMARSKPSIYEDTFDDEENIAPPKFKGRGCTFLWKDQYNVPGGVPHFLERQKETSKEIRMVSSNGFGYCNDQIEHMLSLNQGNTEVRSMDTVKLNASPSKSSLSNKGQSTVGINENPVALYDIIKGKSPKPCSTKNTQEGSLNINSYKEFPKL